MGDAPLCDQACPRCGDGQLELDPIDALVICTSCGYVADEGVLVQGGAEGGAQPGSHGAADGVYVGPSGDHIGLTGYSQAGPFSVGIGKQRGAEESAAYRLRQLTTQLEGIASVMRVPPAVAQEAAQLLQEFRSHVPVMRQQAATLGGLLYCALRRAQLGVALPEVASIAGASTWAVAAQYRLVARTLQLSVPMASIRSLVIRHAAVIVREVYLPAADAPSSGGGGGAAVGSAVVRAHPFMRTAVNVAEMLARHHLGEGKATRTLAAGVLALVLELQPPLAAPRSRGPDALNLLSALTELRPQQLTASKAMVRNSLLHLARLLPFGESVTAASLATYLPTLVELSATLASFGECSIDDSGAHRSRGARGAGGAVGSDGGSGSSGARATGGRQSAATAVPPAAKRPRTVGHQPSHQDPGVSGGGSGGRETVASGAPSVAPCVQGVSAAEPAGQCHQRDEPEEDEEDDARVVLGLMSMADVREERRRVRQPALRAGAAAPEERRHEQQEHACVDAGAQEEAVQCNEWREGRTEDREARNGEGQTEDGEAQEEEGRTRDGEARKVEGQVRRQETAERPDVHAQEIEGVRCVRQRVHNRRHAAQQHGSNACEEEEGPRPRQDTQPANAEVRSKARSVSGRTARSKKPTEAASG